MIGTLDPTTDTENLGELVRGLAHTTRTMGPTVETATMLGSLASGLGGLRQVLDQLAGWHERAADGAVGAAGDGDVGYRHSFDVAMQLSQAAMEVERATAAVNSAQQTAERISWPDADQTPNRVPAGRSDRKLAPPSLFGASETRREPAGIAR
ncbi:hypothetical protein FTX61_07000 [Nitriliruptoraceae bacterium ZYF776]|nr:hypothetical protein [Profundirhabdus halotolerans]